MMRLALLLVLVPALVEAEPMRVQVAAGALLPPGGAIALDVTFPITDTIAIGVHGAVLGSVADEDHISVRSLAAPVASLRVERTTFVSLAAGYVDVFAETLHSFEHHPRFGASLAVRHGFGESGRFTLGAELNYASPTVIYHDTERHDFGGFALALLAGVQSF
jgi:hypothetical protein